MDGDPFDRFKSEGFIKTGDLPSPSVAQDQKAALNRRGNELFNRGDIEAARRVFMTTGYSDGLIRVGDRYYQGGRQVEALKMYWLAKDGRRAASIIEKAARVISGMLREEEVTNDRGPEQPGTASP